MKAAHFLVEEFEVDRWWASAEAIGKPAAVRLDVWPPSASVLSLISASCARTIVRRVWTRRESQRMPHSQTCE